MVDIMSNKVGLCRICGKPGKNICSLCGKNACDEHYDKKSGLCIACRSGRQIK